MDRDRLAAHADAQMTQSPAHAVGMHAVLAGTFDESACAPAGHVDETNYCEGGRDMLRLMDPGPPPGRVMHGEVADG